ncbi:chemotaxis protein CheD [Massilia sp. DJPM01]|uniref:chemotaxis protein CheD n=1 Tax=Massilia sp. DJPM01 TaxID=3024404 RepID=UPI00259F58E3|nr:chemotaxis protein CheD [Massilia sp. DJPM01]MDM5177568.1 chemotaxis protein CheD [Massilia sp. DJPM01]
MLDAGVIDMFLQPGEFFVGDAQLRLRTLLGSCVSITLWHPASRIGAMSHFLLPGRSRGVLPDARYGNDALDLMLAGLREQGVAASECQAKVFGGGDMFPGRLLQRPAIGMQNGEEARALLAGYAIPVLSACLYGVGHRQIVFDIASGDVWSRQFEKVDK